MTTPYLNLIIKLMPFTTDTQTKLNKTTAKIQQSSVVIVKLCLILFSLSILVYLSFASFAPLKNNLLSTFYPKTSSKAYELEQLPRVDLKANYKGALTDGPINISAEKLSESSINLTWTNSGNITSCTGRVWEQLTAASSWAGPKDPRGGSLSLKLPTNPGSYIYTIDCSGPLGDADGDSITINVGGQKRSNLPYVVDFLGSYQNRTLDLNNPTDVPLGQKISLSWSTLNTATPYSICISSGSWPKKYLRQTNIRGSEEFIITERKVYKYTLYCSNESSFTQNTITINGI